MSDKPKATVKTVKTVKTATAKAERQRRVPTAVNLLIYLEDYMTDTNITSDLPLSDVLVSLNESIVAEAKQRVRS